MGQQLVNAKQVFDRAVEIQLPQEREAYLAQACAGAPDLKQRVEALLRAYENAGSFFDSPLADIVATSEQPIPEGPGTVIGPYRLLQQIGEGGMGTVFMAEQVHPVQRKVAFKIVKVGMDSRQVIARFAAEQHALALMEHPNIAKVLDAGVTDTGRPYFVMELVKGVPITRYCDEQHLTPRQRLELFIPVCQAIQHAHQKGIIHRDLKPSNVLIARYDDRPVPKVIDFGVAKATGPTLTDHTLFTEFGQMLGTVQYMSPEQAGLNQLDIDTRSDVYSLGILLYELLTGSTPLEHKRVKQAAFLETLRLVREEEAPRPSTRLSTTDEVASISASRGVEPKKLSGLVRGELDWIVMKAIEKDRSRRYETASGLARDVERYLNDESVEACPPSAGYRLRKFVRRHKGGLAATAVAALAALIGVTGLVINNRLVTRERDQKEAALTRALVEKERADENLGLARRAVNDFLTRVAGNPLLKQADFHPLRRSLLESAIPFYQQFLNQKSDDPKLEVERGRAYGDLAEVRQQLGELDQALDAVQHRLAIFDALVGRFPSNPAYRHELANSHRGVATAFLDSSQHAKAEPEFRSAIALLEKLSADFPSEGVYRQDLAGAYNNLGVLLRGLGRLDEALEVHNKATAARERLVSEFPDTVEYRRDLAESLSNTSSVLSGLGKNDKALALNQQAVEVLRKLAEQFPTSPQYQAMWGMGLDNQAFLLDALGRREDSLAALQQGLRIGEKLAADFPSVPGYRNGIAQDLMNLSILQTEMGRLDDGLASCDKAIGILEALAAESPTVDTYREVLAQVYQSRSQLQARTNRLEPALESSRKAVGIQEKLSAQHPTVPKLREDLALSHSSVGEILCALGRYEESTKSYETALSIRESLASKFPSVVEYAANVGATYASFGGLNLAQKKYEPALDCYAKALAKLAPGLAAEPKLASAQRFAGVIYPNRAMALAGLNRHAEALKDLDRALALEDIENRAGVRLQRARTMAHLKMHAQAIAEADAIASVPDLSGLMLQDAAAVYAICSAALTDDAPRSEQYAVRAVTLLGQAIEKDPTVSQSVASEKDFDVLRERDDFKKLPKQQERTTR